MRASGFGGSSRRIREKCSFGSRSRIGGTRRLLGAVAAAAALAAMSTVMSAAASAEGRTVTIGTAGVMGIYYPLGSAVCRMVNVTRKTHGLRCTVEASEGSVANIEAVLAGRRDMGIAQGDTQQQALAGTGAFAGKPAPTLRALFSLYLETLTIVARDASNIRTVEDLAGKRVAIGTARSGTRATMELVLDAFGMRRDDLKEEVAAKIVEMPPLLCENRIDAFGFVAGHPNPVLQDATGGCRTHVVPVAGPRIDALLARHPYYVATVVPGGLYPGTPVAQPTIGTLSSIVVSADMPDEVAYAITRAVLDNFDDFRKLNPALASLSRAEAVKGVAVPFHPGAERYFREVGLR